MSPVVFGIFFLVFIRISCNRALCESTDCLFITFISFMIEGKIERLNFFKEFFFLLFLQQQVLLLYTVNEKTEEKLTKDKIKTTHMPCISFYVCTKNYIILYLSSLGCCCCLLIVVKLLHCNFFCYLSAILSHMLM